MLASQAAFPEVSERVVLATLLLTQSGGALALQLLGIGSACFLFVNAVPLFVALLLDALLNSGAVVSLWAYALGLLVPLFTGTKLAGTILDVFVPLVRSCLRSQVLQRKINLCFRQDVWAQMRLLNISLRLSSQLYYVSAHRSLRHSRDVFLNMYG
jgi:hypothetical protein